MSHIKKRPIILLLITILTLSIISFTIYYLDSFTTTTHNAESYPVKGVDVSTYQGLIDWPVLATNNLTFAFIKATEGSGFQDDDFNYNFREAHKTPLLVGAYHFFSYETSGETQADNYIKTVPLIKKSMPPVVDIEFYGKHSRWNPPDEKKTREELSALLIKLERHYNKKPIIYTSSKVYALYIADHFEDYSIWISNYYDSPTLPDDKQWTFWQYTDKGVLPGYSGYAPNIDLNVYNGSKEAFLSEFRTDK